MDDDIRKPDPDGEDVVMQQSYPSPMVDNTDAQYYQIAAHREHDPQPLAHQTHQEAVPDGLPRLPAEPEHDLHELQELQEPPRPQQHDPRPPVSAEELQLAAQLTQGLTQGMNQELTPMMAAAEMAAAAASIQSQAEEQQQQLQQQLQQQQQRQEQGQQQHQQQHQHQHQHQPEAAPPPPEPTLQDQLEASLQNHERELQNQNHELQDHNREHHLENHNHELPTHEHDMQTHDHELQTHGLQVQSAMPHPEQPQTHHHFSQNPPPPPQLPPHLSMDHIPAVHPQYQLPESTPPRKRSKVSRACDECRRKKIKCDAQSEASEQPCSNCRRSSAQCLFSRVPQKRGPSKGYIKELADRLNTIEGKLNANVVGDGLDDCVRRSSSEVFASPGPGDESKKRAFSSISNDGYAAASPSRISNYTTEHRPILPYTQPEFRPVNTGSASDLTLKAVANVATFSVPNDLPPLQPQPDAMMEGMSPNGVPQHSPHQANQLPEIEDTAFDCYLTTIHPTLPVLASTKARVQSLLWQSPFDLQLAFYHAFYALMKGFLPPGESFMEGDTGTADHLLMQWDNAHRHQRSTTTDLVRLQTLDMMLIATGCQGIASLKGQRSGWPTMTHIFSHALPLAYEMRLYRIIPEEVPGPELDPNSDDNVALRAWWVLVMCERWNAAGMATPSLIADYAAPLYPGLVHIVGPVVMHLIRISEAVSSLVPLTTWDFSNPNKPPQPVWKVATRSAARRAAADFPVGITDPVLHLAYWHVQLLAHLLCPEEEESVAQTLQICKNMVNLLVGNHELRSPLTHHFVVLLCVGLLHCFKKEGNDAVKTRYSAYLLIQDLLKFALAPSPWNEAVRAKLRAEQARLTVFFSGSTSTAAAAAAAAATASDANGVSHQEQTLQQLADLATNHSHSVDGHEQEQLQRPKEEPMIGGGLSPSQQQQQQQQEQPQVASVVGDIAPSVTKDRFINEGYLTCFHELEDNREDVGADTNGAGVDSNGENNNNHHDHNHHNQEVVGVAGGGDDNTGVGIDVVTENDAGPGMVGIPPTATATAGLAALDGNKNLPADGQQATPVTGME